MSSTRKEVYGLRSARDPTLYVSTKRFETWTSDPRYRRTWGSFDAANTYKNEDLEFTHYGVEVIYLGHID